jgi:multiple sugar transport system permease protein
MYPMPVARWRPGSRLLYKLSLPCALLLWLLPLLAVLVTSIRSSDELSAGNYWGCILITVPSVAVSVFLASMAGHALANYRFRGNLLLLAIFVAGNFVPVQILMIPVRQLTLTLGLYNTVLGLVLFHTAFQTGFCTLFLRNFIRALPYELIEAARVEGASEWAVYTRIVLPLVRPALAALGILVFTFVWNDYFWALCLTQGDDAAPITVGVAALKGQWTTSWNLVSAGSVLAALPSVAMFFAMQKHFVTGLTFGATKG